MKRLVLSTFAAVLAVEGSFHLLGVYDWPSRILGRYPALKLNYSLIFPLLLFVALVFLRKKWPNLPFFALLGAGTAIGLIIGPVAFALGQLIDPLERARFLNGYQRLDLLQILVLQLFVGIGVTLAWLHGGMAAVLTSIIEAVLRPAAIGPLATPWNAQNPLEDPLKMPRAGDDGPI